MLFIIYALHNNSNNKLYIGQTSVPLKIRWKSGSGYKKSPKINNAIQKYGKKNFYYEALTFCSTQEVADYWEDYFINYFNSIKNGYNTQPGGRTGPLGTTLSEETKLKISNSMKEYVRTEEHKQNISISKMGDKNPMFNKSHSEEHNSKIANSMIAENNHFFGKTHSDEARQKMSNKKSGENSRFAKLTWNEVDQIRKMIAEGIKQVKIANIFNVNSATICNINKNRIWKKRDNQ